jgi:hypothetical protein
MTPMSASNEPEPVEFGPILTIIIAFLVWWLAVAVGRSLLE